MRRTMTRSDRNGIGTVTIDKRTSFVNAKNEYAATTNRQFPLAKVVTGATFERRTMKQSFDGRML